MKKILSTIAAICFLTTAAADSVPFGNGQLSFTPIARNAVRIQYQEGEVKQELPEWIYVSNTPVKDADSDWDSFRMAIQMCAASHDALPK